MSDRVTRPKAAIHVDLDGARQIFRRQSWTCPQSDEDPIFESGLLNLLQFLKMNRLPGTFFVIAADLRNPRKRKLLDRVAAEGYEIASHSLTHPEFDHIDGERKRVEIARSRELLEKAFDTVVHGFRAPNYQISRDMLEMLEEHGYKYDSSVFPSAHFARRLEVPFVPNLPFSPSLGGLIELPLPAFRPAPFPFHPSYSLVLGHWYFESCLLRFQRTRAPVVLLFHLTDFAKPLPSEWRRGLRSSLLTLSLYSEADKRSRCQQIVDRVRRSFDFVDTNTLLKADSFQHPLRRLVLGINPGHETSAAIFEGHQCLAAISEERMDRIKLSTNYPPKHSIRQVVATARIQPSAITDVVVAGTSPASLMRRLVRNQLRDVFEFHGWIVFFPHLNHVLYRAFSFARSLAYRRVLPFLRKEYGIRPRIHFVSHHRCHAASAYRTAPFDDALIVSADGVGDDVSLTISTGRRGRIRQLHQIPYPHSFGQFYTACTQMLGFRANRHEGKITGLSAYGKVDPELYRKIKSTIRASGPAFRLNKRFYAEGIIRGLSLDKMLRGEDLFEALRYRSFKSPLKNLIDGYCREDVAAVFQTLLEEELLAVVRPYAEQTGLRNLCLAGGVFANVKLNTWLFRSLGFDQVYVYPNMGDGGLAAGAALELLQTRPRPFDSVCWGPAYSEERIEAALAGAFDHQLRYAYREDVEQTVAELVADNHVVARFDGRMEFGPRALGNRSILCSAQNPEINAVLNSRLGRTEFMPFAPIVMEEHADKLFKGIDGMAHASKFMTTIVECTNWTKEHCPAVVHVDGTARPQLVNQNTNPSAYRILAHYETLTGIPVMVNTSFNMHEEPIVCTPEDAVRAFRAARLDYLAIGSFLGWLEGVPARSAQIGVGSEVPMRR